MLTFEEISVLHYLQENPGATATEMARKCLSGALAEWLDRIASNLDWLGYAIVYHEPGGEVSGLQITERGRRAIAENRLRRSSR